jgi:dolichol-phosphate mannosyltransferase
VILVDNGSTDATPAIAADICAEDPRWRFIRLSRNFGYQNSITAGMLAASGEAIVVIDVDLQDPPELIQQFLAKWQEGYDVVYGVRQQRTGESFWRIGLTMFALRLIAWMSDDVKLPAHSGDFRLISRRVRDAFAQLPETNRYVRGMIHWLGFRQIGIPYCRRGRSGGRSKATWLYLFDFTINAILTSSIKPIRLFSFFGLGVLATTAVGLLAKLFLPLLPDVPPALTAVLILLLFNLGVISLGIGTLGEYLAKVLAESKRRPLWLIDYTINLSGPAALGQPYARHSPRCHFREDRPTAA